jgi:ABC-2 type transport system ATP-binding protein
MNYRAFPFSDTPLIDGQCKFAGDLLAVQKKMLQLQDVSKSFAGKCVLKGITLSIGCGETVAIVGPNGSGKSTLLRLISGLSPVTQGAREVAGEPLRVGYVPDRFPKLKFTPYEYLRDMGRMQGVSNLEARIQDLLAQFRLEFARHQRMTGFSKGMLQKVNLMQALLSQPDLLLLDEPLAGLDQESQHELLAVFLDLQRQGIAIVMICHELTLVEKLAHRIITLHQGRVVSDTSETTDATGMVKVQVRHTSAVTAEVLVAHPDIVEMDVFPEMTTLYVLEKHSHEMLRTLLDLELSIVSVNPATRTEGLFHFRDLQESRNWVREGLPQ